MGKRRGTRCRSSLERKLLRADGRIAVRNWVGKLYAERITLTAPGCQQRRASHLHGYGARTKASRTEGPCWKGPFEPEQLPAQLLQPKKKKKRKKLLWLAGHCRRQHAFDWNWRIVGPFYGSRLVWLHGSHT